MVIDLSKNSDAAYRLAEAIEGGHYTNVLVFEFHRVVNPEGIHRCEEGHEYFIGLNTEFYRIFIPQHRADDMPANISIAVKLGDVWFVDYEAGANYYSGYGPIGIRNLRKACAKQEVRIIYNGDSFVEWYKEQFKKNFITPYEEVFGEQEKSIPEFLKLWKWLVNYSINVQRHRMRYSGKDELELRDHMLAALSTDFDNSAFGEAVQGNGRTDILKRSKDGKSDYVIELKKWKGKSSFAKAVKQLLGYVTWDSAVGALVVYYSGNRFSEVLREAGELIASDYQMIKLPPERQREFQFQAEYPKDKNKSVSIYTLFICLD